MKTDLFAERRRRFMAQMGERSLAVFPAAREAVRSNDTEYPFRQDSDFWYLTGFPEPDAVAVLRPGHAEPYVLFVRDKDREKEIWTGFREGPEGAVKNFGAAAAHSLASWPAMLPELLAGVDQLYTRLGRSPAFDRPLLDAIDELRRKGRQGVEAPRGIQDTSPLLAAMRLIKTPGEVALLDEACRLTAAGHGAALSLAKPGLREYELQAAIEHEFRRGGAAGPGYGTIVAGGANATVLHYTSNRAVLNENDLVLIDAGAEFEGYTGDVTRTFPVGRRFGGPARDVYEIVLRAQLAAIEAVTPGATLDAVHDAACRVIAEGLVSLGVLSGDIERVMSDKAYRPFYMHRTSHWLGLDVHDAGPYLAHGKPVVLAPGMVLTVEPGLYFHGDTPGAGRFQGIGVRIEDDVLVEAGGCRVLTAAIPKDIAGIEAVRSAANY